MLGSDTFPEEREGVRKKLSIGPSFIFEENITWRCRE